MEKTYLFESERLVFRSWSMADLPAFAEMNANEQVMEHFPKTLTVEETKALIERLQKSLSDNGYTYFATEIKASGEFIGFIGLAYQDYELDFLPAVDIGWRLKPSAWGKGYATEGAKRCLSYGFNTLHLERIIATCTINNTKSENVMQKIGMTKKGSFKHPSLKDFPDYEDCLWYEIKPV